MNYFTLVIDFSVNGSHTIIAPIPLLLLCCHQTVFQLWWRSTTVNRLRIGTYQVSNFRGLFSRYLCVVNMYIYYIWWMNISNSCALVWGCFFIYWTYHCLGLLGVTAWWSKQSKSITKLWNKIRSFILKFIKQDINAWT